MKSPRKAYDFKVHVRHQEREEDPSVAPLYRDIFSVTLNDFVEIMFVPYFSRDGNNWSLKIADDVEDVRSLSEARQFTAALSEYTVTPDDERAGEQELIPLAPPLPPLQREPGDPTTGVMFYVTQQEFIRFSQELALMEEHTFLLNEYLPFSEAKEFECMQFILNHIVTSPHFADKDSKIVNLPWYQRRFAPHTVIFNKIERLVPDEDKDVALPRQAAVQSLARISHPMSNQ